MSRLSFHISHKGFTLIELLIVVGLLISIAVVSIPVYTSLYTVQPLHSTREEILSNLRLAQEMARSGKNNSNFGIYIELDTYTLYQGSSYIDRVQSEDRIFSLPNNIHITGIDDINFTKKTGEPSFSGSLLLLQTQTDDMTSISLETNGLIY